MNNLQQWFEQNYLDGDTVQDGQMLSSREAFEAIQRAVREERERIINDILNDPEIPIPRPYEVSWILTKLQHAEKLTTPQEGLQDNSKDHGST